MSKTLSPKSNFRVVIEPRGLGDFGSVRASASFFYGHAPSEQARMRRDQEERANEVLADVKRHVDNVGSAWVEFDQEAVCEHCGSTWTEKSTTYNGGCCEKDEENKSDAQHDSDCSTNNHGVPELLGPCDCSIAGKAAP